MGGIVKRFIIVCSYLWVACADLRKRRRTIVVMMVAITMIITSARLA
jgi:hypothetical protein